MDVLGRDSAREAYRVAIGGPEGRIVGLVPDSVISERLALTGGRGHQTAYDWLAQNATHIETTLRTLRSGARVRRAPFDRIVLDEEP